MRTTVFGIIILGMAACTPHPPPPPADGPAFIRIAEGPCFGTCPVYSMTVFPDDGYELDQIRFTAETGLSTGTVPGAYDAARAALGTAGFASLPSDITGANPAVCGQQVSDLPTVTFEQGPPQAKVVTWDQGCFGAADRDALRQLRGEVRAAFDVDTLIVPSGTL